MKEPSLRLKTLLQSSWTLVVYRCNTEGWSGSKAEALCTLLFPFLAFWRVGNSNENRHYQEFWIQGSVLGWERGVILSTSFVLFYDLNFRCLICILFLFFENLGIHKHRPRNTFVMNALGHVCIARYIHMDNKLMQRIHE